MACALSFVASQKSVRSTCRVLCVTFVAAVGACVASACTRTPAVLTQLVEARRLASDLHVEFTRASDAANRAVMADTDEAQPRRPPKPDRPGRPWNAISKRCSPHSNHSGTRKTWIT